ncbi:hypothetical protein H206_05564 [Candidatus Electrothrix aarhusensis]|uniref:Uncharacterized protein n=1 Tax=Candidatus Electrothrix aarhusensis TaxID=1859131 RepID=A0A444J439_9BACT|nr:hypothetical protein H206_05564 [Candidatus Electrothrix aarhusensis]
MTGTVIRKNPQRKKRKIYRRWRGTIMCSTKIRSCL